ncbi:glycoside hydrolase family 43 protein [Pleomassaria siparia CBS 279.74]|uniref:Glycoside hydrolase family 43 protein n=1 Tax=Pleomassaria siparia CBS 279.74 TaxID=1314801 RepID=A0A6G1K0J8_9PLEO|nr:glycoside hydrolase family 43 protein [Pleomassaria siparia CBS 279.74]
MALLHLSTSRLVALSLLLILVLPSFATARNNNNNNNNSTGFQNPILPGFHPDPSCIHVPEDGTFYCASSSFNVFPGIPIHASQDLTTWKLVGNVLNRPSQLPDLAISNGSTSGIWAPTLRHHNGTFYLVTTLVHDKKPPDDPTRWDNIIFQTRDIWDNLAWTDAVHFDFTGYDTSPYWDDDDDDDDEGTEYIVGSHAYHVEPGIHLAKVDLETGEIKSKWTNLWNGTGGLAPEGPHIYKKDGYYYLMIAEGGTGLDHMETIARSENLYGPYEANPANPILTNANTTGYFQTVGHADLFQDACGNWWGVALSTRSGPEYTTYPMGRETVLTNVTWEDGGSSSWPIFNEPIEGVMHAWELPPTSGHLPGDNQYVTEGDENIQFPPGSKMPQHFVHWRFPVDEAYTMSPEGHENALRLRPSKLNLTGVDGNTGAGGGQTFVGRRQVDTLFTYSVDVDYTPKTLEEEAGVTLFLTQAINHHVRLGIALLPVSNTNTNTNTTTLVPHFRFHAISYVYVPASFSVVVPPAWNNKTLTMEIEAVNVTHYSFSAAPVGRPRRVIAYAPGKIVSWGFTGTLLGVYATSNGGNGTQPAYVSNWNYLGRGQVRDN